MSAHTPGPWNVSTSDRYVRYRGIHGPNICDLEPFGGPRDEQEANAHLIAAAPELLAALESILTLSVYMNSSGNGVYGTLAEISAKAQTAIRKAKGK